MKLKLSEDVDVSIDMSPMIDMVFLLLIFFIVASAMVDTKPPVKIPSASQSKTPKDTVGRLMVTVNKDEQIFIGSVPVTMDEFKETVAKELEANPDLRIFIRADENVPYRVNKALMTACAKIGATDLIYAAFEE